MVRFESSLRRLFAVGLVGIFAGGGGVFAATIRLKARVVVEAQQDVRLGDVATVSDPDPKKAEELANTVVLSGVDRGQKLDGESILMAVMAQRGAGFLGSDLRMSGAADCEITLGGQAERGTGAVATAAPVNAAQIMALPAEAMSPTNLSVDKPAGDASVPARAADSGNASAAKTADAPAADAGPLTLTKLISQQVQNGVGGAPEDVRIRFNTISPLLDAPVSADQKWLCRSYTRTLLGTVEFEAQLVQGTKVLERLNVETRVEKRQQVVVANKKIARGDVVAQGQVSTEEQWLDRNLPNLFGNAGEAVGLEATRDVDVGSPLDERDFRQALMAHKNEAVNVIYIAGSLQVEIRGRAMDDGKLHDRIDIRNETTGERYSAVMIGKNLAVAGGTLSPEQEKKLQETDE